MDNKFYISYVAAMLLKEKGYDKPTDYIYVIDGPFYSIWRNKDGNMESNYYPAPTKAEAIDWLKSKRIYISSIVDCDSVGVFYTARIIVYDNKNNYHNYSIFEDNDNRYMKIYKTRLEAEEAAIIKACELL